MDYHGLSWTNIDYHGLSLNILDYLGFSWLLMDYPRQSWTIMDYHRRFIWYLEIQYWHKEFDIFFALFLQQIFVNFQKQGQIWNLLVLTFSKLSLYTYQIPFLYFLDNWFVGVELKIFIYVLVLEEPLGFGLWGNVRIIHLKDSQLHRGVIVCI